MSDFFIIAVCTIVISTLSKQGSSPVTFIAILHQNLALSQFLFCSITFRDKNMRQCSNIGIFIPTNI